MATCRCPMCGSKDAGKTHRGLYIRHGVRCSEKRDKGVDKVRGRRILRRRLKSEVRVDD